MTDREYRTDSGLSERYTARMPMAIGGDRSSYRSDYMTEYDDYATLGNRTPTTSSIGMIVRPKQDQYLVMGLLHQKVKEKVTKLSP